MNRDIVLAKAIFNIAEALPFGKVYGIRVIIGNKVPFFWSTSFIG